MFRNVLLIVTAAVCGFGSAVGFAQGDDDEELAQLREELQSLRTDYAEALRELERAAREVTVATVPRIDFTSLQGVGGDLLARARLGLELASDDAGVEVVAVTPGSAAERAGVERGDRLLAIDELDLAAEESPIESIVDYLEDFSPGEPVELSLRRAGTELTVEVETQSQFFVGGPSVQVDVDGGDYLRLFTRAPSGSAMAPLIVTHDAAKPGSLHVFKTLNLTAEPWGEMELVSVTADLGRYFGTDEGLLVVRGPGEDAVDIRDGDVILSITGRRPNSPEHAIRILSSFEPGETIVLALMRDGSPVSVEYRVP